MSQASQATVRMPATDALPVESRELACNIRCSVGRGRRWSVNSIVLPVNTATARWLPADGFCCKTDPHGRGRSCLRTAGPRWKVEPGNQRRPATVSLNYGWQHDPELWDLIPRDLRDSRSWRSVGFVENEAVSVPSGQPGIYFFCTSPVGRRLPAQIRGNDLFSNLFTPIYIGKTDNLRRRFLDHCRNPSRKMDSARLCFGASMQFWFHKVSQDRMKSDEAILIRCFGPTANERMESIQAVVKEPIPIGVHDRRQERHGRKA